MSEAPKDGGPAFPVLYGQTNGLDGMSLRDWFAGQALAGDLAASPNYRPSRIGSAERAYAYADAMLALRSDPVAPDLIAALKEANAFILAPAEDLKDGVLSRIRAAISQAQGSRT